MKVLVLGGAGYIGSHLVRYLAAGGHAVVVADALFGKDGQARAARLAGAATVLVGDVRDEAFVESCFAVHKPDAVVHMCAFIAVGDSVKDPLTYFDNNVVGSLRVLQAMVRHGCKQFVFSSTAALFGTPEKQPIEPNDPVRPDSPYGDTKAMTETILRACDTAHGIKSVCLRYFNACGASPSGDLGETHEPETHLIPLILKVALGQRASIGIFGTDYPTPDGTCVRDYIHVDDLASAHGAALVHLAKGGDSLRVNLGTGTGYSVRQVIESARRVTGHPIPAVEQARRPGDPAQLVASPEAAQRLLGWTAASSDLDTIVATAWRFHQNHPNGYPAVA